MPPPLSGSRIRLSAGACIANLVVGAATTALARLAGDGIRQRRFATGDRRVATRPILTITDAPPGLADGSVLNFVLGEGRIRFEASLRAAERAGLKLSARLLAVAEPVQMP